MARQYKVKIETGTPSDKIEFFWHDNDTFEFVNIPASLAANQIQDGISMMKTVVHFMRTYGKASFKVELP